MRLIDADELYKAKFHPLPYPHITPSDADAESYERGWNDAIDAIMSEIPTIEERKTGKWLERHHAYADEEKVIEEWQSCKCSVCGRYDTRPYLYYFSEPRFCSWCGADMRGEGHE